MNKPHLDHIDTAFLQLSFAIKLWHFLDEHPIEKENFDIALTIEDVGSRVCLAHNEFKTYQELQVAAENNISICFGAVAITLWKAIREHTGWSSGRLNPKNSRGENLAALSYMIRCCFAHGTARPVWSIYDSKYKTVYCVGNKTIDLSNIADKQPFDYPSIGGYETLWDLKAEARDNGLL
jgi:hypothetical protein